MSEQQYDELKTAQLQYPPATVRPPLPSREFKPVRDVAINKIVFLGTSSATPLPLRRNVSSLAIILSSGGQILCDCGEGTQHQLMKSNFARARKIDLICITHLHGDHCFGIFGLLCTLAQHGREEALTIVGPKGIRQMVENVLKTQGGWYSYPFHFIELEGTKSIDLGPLTDGINVSAHPIAHRIETFGYLFEEPSKEGPLDAAKAKKLGVKGQQLGQLKRGQDVTLADGTVVQSRDVVGASKPGKRVCLLQDTHDARTALPYVADCDVMIHESTYDKSMEQVCIERGHSTAQMAGRFARTARAKQLILTHFSARYENSLAKTDDPEGLTLVDLRKEAQKECPDTNVLAAFDYMMLTREKDGEFVMTHEVPRGLDALPPSVHRINE